MKAKRNNKGKVDMTLLPTDALRAEARVWMHGEQEYGRDNWQKLWGDDTINVVMASLLRHAFAIMDGEVYDEKSGEQHAAHIRCNAAMLIRYFSSSSEKSTPSPDQTRARAIAELQQWAQISEDVLEDL